jgi:hypothetical protein
MSEDAFTGWAVLELFGHRRLAGYVRQAEQFGTAMLRLDVPEHPWVDGCTCGSSESASLDHEKHNATCHMFRAEGDDEPLDVHATQFYGGSSIYAITPATEEVARTVASRARPVPVQSWEFPRPALEPPAREEYPHPDYLDEMEADMDELDRETDEELAGELDDEEGLPF